MVGIFGDEHLRHGGRRGYTMRLGPREYDMHTDSLCRSSTRLDRRRCLARSVHALPVQSFEQGRQLRRGQANDPVLHVVPAERTVSYRLANGHTPAPPE